MYEIKANLNTALLANHSKLERNHRANLARNPLPYKINQGHDNPTQGKPLNWSDVPFLQTVDTVQDCDFR